MSNENTISFNMPPSAGYWRFPGSGAISTQIYMERRPRWLTRFLMKWLLEFVWVDK